MKDELKQYQVETNNFWKSANMFGSGYDVMERATKREWKPVASWGRDGYDLGSWPYVMVYFRTTEESFDLAYYVEGDVDVYACPSKELREAITDELAFYHWQWNDEEWVKGYTCTEDLPEELRGPYRH